MHGNLPADPQGSMFPTVSSDGDKSLAVSLDSASNGWFVDIAKILWAPKVAAALCHLTKAKERQCFRYASGHQAVAGKFVVALLRSSDGGRFLDRIMHGSDAAWWRALDRAERVTERMDEQFKLDLR